jgi:hypothetical protein
MATPVCNVLGTILGASGLIYDKINRRVSSLRRLAYLLENLGDLNSYIPDINALVPIAQIDLLLYEELQRACPQLGLPNVTGLNDLKATVASAYAELQTAIQNSPYNRMGGIQGRLDAYLSKITQQRSPWDALNWLGCLQFAVCDFPATASQAASKSLYEQQIGVFSTALTPGTSPVKQGVVYNVRGEAGSTITYDNVVYHPGDSFYGVANKTTFAADGADLYARPYVTSDIQRQKIDQAKAVSTWISANGTL